MAPGWRGGGGPHGGYISAIVLRAMIAELGDAGRLPRSFTIHFASPPADGPCEVVVRVERIGRSLATLSARLEQEGELRALALGAFSPSWPAEEVSALAPPGFAPAADVPVLPFHPSMPDFFRHVEVRPTLGGFVGAGGNEVGGWLRTRPAAPLDAPAAAFLLDAMWPAIYPALEEPVGAPTVDLTVHFRRALPAVEEPLAARFAARILHDGFFEEDGELWTPRGDLLAQSRQLALLARRRGG